MPEHPEYEYRVVDDLVTDSRWLREHLGGALNVLEVRPTSLHPRIQRREVGPWEDVPDA